MDSFLPPDSESITIVLRMSKLAFLEYFQDF